MSLAAGDAAAEAAALSCADLSLALGEAMAGTAPAERFVLAVEVCGPWGRDPAGEVPAPPGVRVQALRRTTTRYRTEARRAWLAGVAPGERFLEAFDDARALEGRDLTSGPTGAGVLEDEPLFLCCTHGTRDACCARLGVPLHRAVCGAAPERTWHSSHLGGHRFAATMAILPHGAWLGRVPAARGREIVALAREGRVPVDLLRGFAGRPPAEQVVEAHLRRERGLDGIEDAVDLSGLTARRAESGRPRPLSCGEGAKVEDPGGWEIAPP